MKHALKMFSALALFAGAFVAHAESKSIDFGSFDTTQDPACWVAPEWRD